MSQSDYINFEIAELIGKYLRNEISEEEMVVLENWRTADLSNRHLWNKLTNGDYTSRQLKQWPDNAQSDALWMRLQGQVMHSTSIHKRKFFAWRIAAGFVVLVLAVGVVFYLSDKQEPVQTATVSAADELPVGGLSVPSGVTLVTGDGQRVVLDDETEVWHEVDGTQINRDKQGLSYFAKETPVRGRPVAHTVMTPAARTYNLVLADGTKVWLNASSSIQYPTAFEVSERRVTLHGEAYFEVAEDKTRPFIVMTGKSRIQVLGTHFNVRSYPGNGVERTALLSGSVTVMDIKRKHMIQLQPGFEVIVDDDRPMIIQKTDANKVLAWRQGLFVFENERLESLLAELSSWYDIHPHFVDPETKNYRFTGRLQRYTDIQTLLDIITETAKVRFSLKNNQLLVNKAK
ncbi:FecR family protein [Parapedobacter koreensis]|uniref:FecR family protein n=1 Tax=Parapedobacter koreensis TaxID=332977 RepID=A0A1H7UJS0_9SPHI|nr:FecR domain-containing protein [Parapedobacter koreensis]SEL97282.1 FecR family protein [Parapedobacter koreensis]